MSTHTVRDETRRGEGLGGTSRRGRQSSSQERALRSNKDNNAKPPQNKRPKRNEKDVRLGDVKRVDLPPCAAARHPTLLSSSPRTHARCETRRKRQRTAYGRPAICNFERRPCGPATRGIVGRAMWVRRRVVRGEVVVLGRGFIGRGLLHFVGGKNNMKKKKINSKGDGRNYRVWKDGRWRVMR
ncbi:hypothetical protein BKA81DRAFT_370960 [Phyllosticta paracitricarpa]